MSPETELEKRYGFAANVAAMSNAQLLEQRDLEKTNSGSGRARTCFLYCLQNEIERRKLD